MFWNGLHMVTTAICSVHLRRPTKTKVLVLEGDTCLHPHQPFFVELTLHLQFVSRLGLGRQLYKRMVSPAWYTTTNLPKIALLKGGWCIYCMFCSDLPHYVQKFHASWVDKHATKQKRWPRTCFGKLAEPPVMFHAFQGNLQKDPTIISKMTLCRVCPVGASPPGSAAAAWSYTLFLVVPLGLSPRGLHHEKAGDDPCFVHELWVSWNRPRFVGIRPGF